jgi:hypothetical protein
VKRIEGLGDGSGFPGKPFSPGFLVSTPAGTTVRSSAVLIKDGHAAEKRLNIPDVRFKALRKIGQ